MTDLEKVKAEIARLKQKNLEWQHQIEQEEGYSYEMDVCCGYDEAIEDFETFVETLEKEEPQGLDEAAELEPAIDEYLRVVKEASLRQIARYFAQWGAKWQAEQFNLSDMKSPFTGGRVFLKEEPTEVVFRGETLTINRKYYQCEDTGKQFTNEELDGDNQWATFRAYWENKGFEHFYDIDNYEGR